MMQTDRELKNKWDNLPLQSEGYIRIDSDHEIDWYIGYESINQKSLLLISKSKPSEIPSSKSIAINIGERKDGNWALVLKLTSINMEEVFVRLCWDLIESSRSYFNDENGLAFIADRYKQWAKLMENQRVSILTDAQQKGLIGELHYISEKILSGEDSLEIISSWIGPEGADQDFVYANRWHEVKTTGISSVTVSISSIEQLDVAMPGELIIYFADPTSLTDTNGVTLKSEICIVKDLLKSTPAALSLFEGKLLTIGYIDLPDYDKKPYKISGQARYNVEGDFPRLTRSLVPIEVSSVEYRINIQAISPWKII